MLFIARLISSILCKLPVNGALFIGRLGGNIFYWAAAKKRKAAYLNLKRALGEKYSEKELKGILKQSFINFSQNIIEAFCLPRVDKGYIGKYVEVSGQDNIEAAFRDGKGVIIAGTHFGSWEISSAAGTLLGYNYNVVFKQQSNPVLDVLLNEFRQKSGAKIFPRGFSIREIIKALKNKEMVALAMDQGRFEDGEFVELFGNLALVPTGTLRIALKTQAKVIPAYIHRVRGAYHRLVFLPPLGLEGVDETNLTKPLREYNQISEGFISQFPQDYTWFYKRWKRTPTRNCLILSDSKAGHLSQSRGLVKILKKTKLDIKEAVIEVNFKNRLAKLLVDAAALLPILPGRAVLQMGLAKDSFARLDKHYADVIISCGSSLAGVNLLLSKQYQAKSLVLMKPRLFSPKRFNLTVALKHDRLEAGPRVINSDLALNTVDQESLSQQRQSLIDEYPQLNNLKRPVIALFLGGPNRDQALTVGDIKYLITAIKKMLEKRNGDILVTTSRRTPKDVEAAIKEEFLNNPYCPLLVIANEYNPAAVLGGMLALADLAVVTSDSISMVSEAVSSGKPTVVFKLPGLAGTKHETFLKNLEEKKYIKCVDRDFTVIEILSRGERPFSPTKLNELEEKIIKVVG